MLQGYKYELPGEEDSFTAQQKIKSQTEIFRYRINIFCLPHGPKISDFLDLCLQWVSVVRDCGGMLHKNRRRRN